MIGQPRPGRRVSRAGLLVVLAVLAAALVLGSGALRSAPSGSPGTSSGTSALASDGALASLPVARSTEPSIAATPEPPDPTAIPNVRGEFVGALGSLEGCPILYQRDGVLELILPDGYRSRIRGGQVQILRPSGTVLATEGDLLGLDGRVRDGASTCMTGPQLHVSRIVEVVARGSS